MNKRFVFWSIAQTLAAILGMMAFFSFATWLATKPISEAPFDARSALPAGCPAYAVNHGAYICEWRNTIAKNHVGFTINALLLAASLGFIYFTGFTGRGFQLPRPRPGFWRWRSHAKDEERAGSPTST
jgi:hypothetical protein